MAHFELEIRNFFAFAGRSSCGRERGLGFVTRTAKTGQYGVSTDRRACHHTATHFRQRGKPRNLQALLAPTLRAGTHVSDAPRPVIRGRSGPDTVKKAAVSDVCPTDMTRQSATLCTTFRGKRATTLISLSISDRRPGRRASRRIGKTPEPDRARRSLQFPLARTLTSGDVAKFPGAVVAFRKLGKLLPRSGRWPTLHKF